MNAPELQALRRLLFLSSPEAARWVAADEERPRGVDERTWNRWESGRVSIPRNVAARVLELVAWRAAAISSALEALAELRQQQGEPEALRLVAYPETDDWRGPAALWRPAQSAAAHVLALWPQLVRLVPFDARAYLAWRQARNLPDGEATRAAWAGSVDLSPEAPPGDDLAPKRPPRDISAPLAPIEGSPPTPSTNQGVVAALRIEIPASITFADLKLKRHPVTLDIGFDWVPIEAICAASNIDPDVFKRQHADNVAGLIAEWYRQHVAHGGAPDPVAEQITAEVEAEAAAGGPAGVIAHRGGLQ